MKKRDIIFMLIVVAIVLVGGLIVTNTLKITDDNRLEQLRYNVIESNGDSLSGVIVDENGKVRGKHYVSNKKFTTITVEVSPYSTYEEAVNAGYKNKYLEYHGFVENNNPGIENIICGVLEENAEPRGAMAWIYTECGTYTILVVSMASNYKFCEEKLHSILHGISLDKDLSPEIYP